jgi:anti-anti-sigma factor
LLLSKSGNNDFVLDLSNVKYCDSSGLSALLVGNRLAKENDGKLTIFGINPAVEKIISISQLDTILNIASDERGAI